MGNGGDLWVVNMTTVISVWAAALQRLFGAKKFTRRRHSSLNIVYIKRSKESIYYIIYKNFK